MVDVTASSSLLTQDSSDDDTGIEIEDIGVTEPFDPNLIRINTKPLTIDLVLSRLQRGELDLSTGFQRKAGIWKDAAQSRLIESILIRIPLPAFYLDATNEDRWLVVDGLQRLTALNRFVITQELRLTGLDFLRTFEGKHYDDIPRNFQRRIRETQVTVYLIEEGTPPTVKFNIFKRINTGGLPLSAQEIRHALNQGPVTKMLEELAKTVEFQEATARGIRDDRMADRECVLRFLSFCLTDYKRYSAQDFDGFLSETMVQINEMQPADREALASRFTRSMRAAFKIFEELAFRKQDPGRDYRFPINKALFEAWSVNLDHLSDRELDVAERGAALVNKKFLGLMSNQVFLESISQGTGDIAKVRGRFGEIERLLGEVVHDPAGADS